MPTLVERRSVGFRSERLLYLCSARPVQQRDKVYHSDSLSDSLKERHYGYQSK